MTMNVFDWRETDFGRRKHSIRHCQTTVYPMSQHAFFNHTVEISQREIISTHILSWTFIWIWHDTRKYWPVLKFCDRNFKLSPDSTNYLSYSYIELWISRKDYYPYCTKKNNKHPQKAATAKGEFSVSQMQLIRYWRDTSLVTEPNHVPDHKDDL